MMNAGDSFRVLDVTKNAFIETEKRFCTIHMADGNFCLQSESLNN